MRFIRLVCQHINWKKMQVDGKKQINKPSISQFTNRTICFSLNLIMYDVKGCLYIHKRSCLRLHNWLGCTTQRYEKLQFQYLHRSILWGCLVVPTWNVYFVLDAFSKRLICNNNCYLVRDKRKLLYRCFLAADYLDGYFVRRMNNGLAK